MSQPWRERLSSLKLAGGTAKTKSVWTREHREGHVILIAQGPDAILVGHLLHS